VCNDRSGLLGLCSFSLFDLFHVSLSYFTVCVYCWGRGCFFVLSMQRDAKCVCRVRTRCACVKTCVFCSVGRSLPGCCGVLPSAFKTPGLPYTRTSQHPFLILLLILLSVELIFSTTPLPSCSYPRRNTF
jgi:hypothetical protein